MIENALKSTIEECAHPFLVCSLIMLFLVIFVETVIHEIRERKKNTPDRKGSQKNL